MESSSSSSSSFSSVQDSNFEYEVLPTDLITEILLRLPVKPLLKFKCVSKSWLDLISSPRFVKRHLNISTNNNSYHRLMLGFNPSRKYLKGCSVSSLLKYFYTMAIDLDCPPKKSYQSIKVVGSINGLICVAIAEIDYQSIKDFFLWNPSIRKLKKLPSSTTGSFYMYGFGYDELQDDYKVVEITKTVYDTDSRYNVGKIYSLNNNSWRRLDDLQIEKPCNDSGVLVNEKLHWAVTKKNFGYYNNWFILVVDLANGRWEEMEYPYYGERIYFFPCYLGMLGNDLSMSCYPHVLTHVDVWVMKEYGVKESWTKMFIIKYPNDLMEYRLFGPTFYVSSEGEILFNSGPVFMIYNPNEDSMRFSDVSNCGHVVVAKATLYIESLVWPFVAEGIRDATTSKAAKALINEDNRVINNLK